LGWAASEAGEQEREAEVAPWLDPLHDQIAGGIDVASRWVDGFFGDETAEASEHGAYGRVGVRVTWHEYEGTDIKGKLRAYLPLGNLRDRVHAVLGRGDTEDIIDDAHHYEDFFSTGRKDDWLMGLGYTPPWSDSGRVSLGAGVRLDWPLDPYIRASYHMMSNISDHFRLRFRESVFWRKSEEFGCSTSIDLDYPLADKDLLRWANWGKYSERTAGLSYESQLMWYHQLSENRGVIGSLRIRGETDSAVPIREYGVYAVYRQRLWRDWLFGELMLGLGHYQADDWDNRRSALVSGIGFEFHFDKDLELSVSSATSP